VGDVAVAGGDGLPQGGDGPGGGAVGVGRRQLRGGQGVGAGQVVNLPGRQLPRGGQFVRRGQRPRRFAGAGKREGPA
jgi:hypothetical protein